MPQFLILAGLVAAVIAGFLLATWVGFATASVALLFTGFSTTPRRQE